MAKANNTSPAHITVLKDTYQDLIEACTTLKRAYDDGEVRGGFVEWEDIDSAYTLAVEVLKKTTKFKRAKHNALDKRFVSLDLSRQSLIAFSLEHLTPEQVLSLSDDDMQSLADRLGEEAFGFWCDHLIEDHLPRIVRDLTS